MRLLVCTVSFILGTVLIAGAQKPAPRLARVSVVEVDGQRPVLEVVANAPLAFNVLRSGKRLEVRIYGVEAGLVPLDQLSALGRVTLRKEKRGDLLLRLTPLRGVSDFTVRTGTRPNVIEIASG
jgi:hypothetical protein